MSYYKIIIFFFFLFFTAQSFSQSNLTDSSGIIIDSTEYELIIFDPGYELYLISQPPISYYSKNYYKSWNIKYVSEWNNRHILRANTGLFESYIDYNPFVDYDLELEYKLYYYFQFFEEKNNIVLIPRGK